MVELGGNDVGQRRWRRRHRVVVTAVAAGRRRPWAAIEALGWAGRPAGGGWAGGNGGGGGVDGSWTGFRRFTPSSCFSAAGRAVGWARAATGDKVRACRRAVGREALMSKRLRDGGDGRAGRLGGDGDGDGDDAGSLGFRIFKA
ncbi:hypothetical protein NL676_023852 [Syzygium grande]|nr:hypothetical protein NL676_023852 [Syzygium grande]